MEFRYADSHVHLDRYSDVDVAAMLERARAAALGWVLTVGVDAASSRRAVDLAQRFPGVLAAVGLHPRQAQAMPDLDAEMAGIDDIAAAHRDIVRAIGEIGLDLPSGAAEERAQRRAFAAQLDLAANLGLPVVLHSAGAHAQSAAVLRSVRPRLPAVIVHYFVGGADDLRPYLDLDCLISFGRPLLKPGQDALREAAKRVPLDRLLVETDTYPLPGRTTEPRDVVEVVAALAALRGEPEEQMAPRIVENFRVNLTPASETRSAECGMRNGV